MNDSINQSTLAIDYVHGVSSDQAIAIYSNQTNTPQNITYNINDAEASNGRGDKVDKKTFAVFSAKEAIFSRYRTPNLVANLPGFSLDKSAFMAVITLSNGGSISLPMMVDYQPSTGLSSVKVINSSPIYPVFLVNTLPNDTVSQLLIQPVDNKQPEQVIKFKLGEVNSVLAKDIRLTISYCKIV